ncbi:PREDICTED: phospholipase B1, membrane-associated-like [Habropoda laboriosa]|uniref:phospholipase B1, membrane-associated-like n=1 Tax=Habropoda laboriosa TaxID=597456 RepID=UPI00083DD784|nr:PREDICTED: phospholipase B1, membrane-associated-like [Habropoda laboriosa]
MKRLCMYFVLQLCVLTASQKTSLDSPINLYIYRHVRNWVIKNFGPGDDPRRYEAGAYGKVQDEVPIDVPFPCNVTGGRSSEIPDSVHRLRPGDIDVIAAMGDSLTAGVGIFATDLIGLPIENRGAAGSIGGQGTWRTYLTLPNILKEFNPNLVGYALGDSLTSHPASQLNVAELGAMSKDMPFMAKYLVNRIRNDSRIDINKHWKLISISIGSNDFCAEMCAVSSPWSLIENHKIDLINTLRILRDNLPRTFLTLNLPPHLEALIATRQGRSSLKCYAMTNLECPCLFALQYRDRRPEYYDIMRSWQELEEEIANYEEFQTDDFTVVTLPTLKRVTIPLAEDGYSDVSYLSADCFHVSQKANARFANGIWNNLLEPIGNKTERWYAPYERFLCPTEERPYLMTIKSTVKENTVSELI